MKYIDERYYLQKNKQGYECRRKKISTALRVPVCNYHYQEIKEKIRNVQINYFKSLNPTFSSSQILRLVF